MRSVNNVVLIGNITRDPEMKTTLNNQFITTLGLATNRDWMTKDGRKQQSSEFHEVVCWGRLAEIAKQYLTKGKLVYISGYLKTRSWDNAQGVKCFRTEIVAEDLIMLEKRPRNEEELAAIGQQAGQNEFDQPTISIEDPLTI